VILPVDLRSSGSAKPPNIWPLLPLAAQGRRLVEDIQPFAARHDISGLLKYLERVGWKEPALIAFLTCRDDTIIRAAAWCLGYVGTMRSNLPLASVLHHDDPGAVCVAENALWSIWLRAGSPCANERLCAAIRLAEQDRYDEALAELEWVTRICPDFAEAYNQQGIVRFLQGRYCKAIRNYRHAVDLNPVHFGARAALGHCYAALGRYAEALDAYHKALAVHPRLEGVRQAISQIKQLIGQCGQAGRFGARSA